MELLMDKKEFQIMSSEFRRVASRLLKTNVDDGLDNLKDFSIALNTIQLFGNSLRNIIP